MDLQQINIKVFTTEDSQINYENFIRVFNRWMAEGEPDEYLNYADYSFTHAGHGVLLISASTNYSIDAARSRHGFLYNRKHKVEGDNREKIRQAFTETLQRCVRVEEAEELENQVHLNGDEILFFINNRHIAPNTQEMLEAIQPDLTAVLSRCMAGTTLRLNLHLKTFGNGLRFKSLHVQAREFRICWQTWKITRIHSCGS